MYAFLLGLHLGMGWLGHRVWLAFIDIGNQLSKMFVLIYSNFFFSFFDCSKIWNSQARDQIQAAVVTYTSMAATPGPLTYCSGLGIEPVSWCCRDAADPVVPQRELPPAVFKSSSCNISLLTSEMVSLFSLAVSFCEFKFYFPWWLMKLNMLSYVYWSFIYHLSWGACQVFCPFSFWVVFLFCIDL